MQANNFHAEKIDSTLDNLDYDFDIDFGFDFDIGFEFYFDY